MASAELMKAEDLECGDGGGQYVSHRGVYHPMLYSVKDWTVPAH